MWQKIKKQKIVLIITLLAVSISSIFFLPHKAESVQIKRVIRGSAPVATDDVITIVDLSGDLGGDNLNLDRSIVFITNSINLNAPGQTLVVAKLDDPTTLVLSRGAGGTTTNVEYTIVEFVSDVRVLHGSTFMGELNTTKVTSLPYTFNLSRTFAIARPKMPIAKYTPGGIASTYDDRWTITNVLANPANATTNITFKRNNYANKWAPEIIYDVFEFQPNLTDSEKADVYVQSGETSIGSGLNNTTVDLTSGSYKNVTKDKALLFFSRRAGSSTGGDERYFEVKGEIVDNSTLKFTRVGTTNSTDIAWYTIDFKDDSLVSHASTGDQTGTTYDASVSNINNLTRAFSITSVMGGSSVTTTGAQDEVLVRANLTSTSNLLLTRETAETATPFDVAYSVGELPAVRITSPAGDELWKVGETPNITWECAKSAESDKVTLTMSKDNGSTYPITIASDLAASNKTYSWLINNSVDSNNPIDNDLKIKITDNNLSYRNFDVSNKKFEIKGTLGSLSPGGGQTWYIGEQKTITWNKTGNFDYSSFNITYSRAGDNFTAFQAINTSASQAACGCGPASTQNNCSYTWIIPNEIGQSYKVRVALNDDTANMTLTSATNFTITGLINVTSPVANETWYVGESRPINWTKYGNFTYANTTFNISLFDGTTNTTLFPALNQTQAGCNGEDLHNCSYSWTVPTKFGTNFKIRVFLNAYPDNITGTSAGNFSIKGTINLTSPDGGQDWLVTDTNRTINWTKLGDFSAFGFNITVSDNGGADYNYTIASNLLQSDRCTGNNCSYAWNPLNFNNYSTGSKLKAKVYVTSDPVNFTDSSADNFTIKGKLNLTYPNATGGNTWFAQSEENIT